MKKNLLKIPGFIQTKLSHIQANEIIVATTVTLSEEDILADMYPALGIKLDSGRLEFKTEQIPSKECGRYCKRNIIGKTKTRKDLPKVIKTIHLGERPIFGDWAKGSFSLDVSREVYQKETEKPRGYRLGIELLAEEMLDSQRSFVFKVLILDSLNTQSPEFDFEFLYQLNILQECIGKTDVFAANSANEEFLRVRTINWEIFPPGERDQDIVRILGKLRKVTPEIKKELTEKYDFLIGLNPQELLVGVHGLRGYFGAKFSDNLVVFESLKYGHAIYVLYEDWQELSKLSRSEILQLPDKQFDRIRHTIGWKNRLSNLIKNKTA